jgi:hypothetical protein
MMQAKRRAKGSVHPSLKGRTFGAMARRASNNR